METRLVWQMLYQRQLERKTAKAKSIRSRVQRRERARDREEAEALEETGKPV